MEFWVSQLNHQKDILRVEVRLSGSGIIRAYSREASASEQLRVLSENCKSDLEALTDEDREDIRTGKKAPRQFLPDKTKGKPKKEAPHKKALSEIREVEKSAKGIAKALSRIDNESERSKTYVALQKAIGNLQALLPAVEASAENINEE